MTERRVALIHNATDYVGPALARLLAARGCDLVLGDPAPGLVDELTGTGADVLALDHIGSAADPASSSALVAAALDRHGRIDAAALFSGQIVTGRFLDHTADDLARVVRGCVEPPFHFLQAVLPPMLERRKGQILVITSASAARATKGAPLYSSARAAATHLVRNVAAEVAGAGVQVNAVGTNFMDFPAFRAATGADDPATRATIEAAVPMHRLGTMEELAAMCAVFLDGTSGFTTGQFVAYAGGWA